MNKLLLAALLSFISLAAWAGDAKDLAEDPAVEKRMVEVTSKLRCLVCQNETIAASQAQIANDLRRQVRELIRAGKSDDEIYDYMVQRYGDFVLYQPQVKSYNAPLWIGPIVLLLAGAGILFYQLRRRGRMVPEADLSAEAQQRAAALLKDEEKQ